MGCGASSAGGAEAPKGTPIPASGSARMGSVRRSAWEHSRNIGSQQWTAHSTMTAAKQAMAQGMPEPPDSYFETQDRLATFFLEHGTQKIFDPREVILEPGSKLDLLYMIEEGSVTAEKDICVMRKPIAPDKLAADPHADKCARPLSSTARSAPASPAPTPHRAARAGRTARRWKRREMSWKSSRSRPH